MSIMAMGNGQRELGPSAAAVSSLGTPSTYTHPLTGMITTHRYTQGPNRTQMTSMTDRQHTARLALSLLDLTSLGDDDTEADVAALCTKAVTKAGPVAAICVWPRFVARAVEELGSLPVPVAAVANFPGGGAGPAAAASTAAEIVEAGGTEVDVVVPWRQLVDGEVGACEAVVSATRRAVGQDVVVKAILETGELETSSLIRAAALEAIAGGADFLKTSTGRARPADLDAANVLLGVILEADRPLGLKISGGVRTLDDASAYMTLVGERMPSSWVSPERFRFGASSLLDALLSELSEPRS